MQTLFFLLHVEQFNTHGRCELWNNEEHSKPGQCLIVDPGFTTLRHGSQPLSAFPANTEFIFIASERANVCVVLLELRNQGFFLLYFLKTSPASNLIEWKWVIISHTCNAKGFKLPLTYAFCCSILVYFQNTYTYTYKQSRHIFILILCPNQEMHISQAHGLHTD
jgi:hypothetical protein